MKNLSIMIKPASSLCNLRCKYCFYGDVAGMRQMPSYGIMTEEIMEAVLTNIYRDLTPGDSVTFAFQGGEPCMAGLRWFRQFTAIVGTWHGIQIHYALQTNATLLNAEWCAFLKEYDFLVGVSWDLLPQCHDDARVDSHGCGTGKAVLEGIALLNRFHVEYNVLCTLTNFVARHPDKVWRQLEAHSIAYVQFTPCLDGLDSPGSPYALTPERFASFYTRIFELWYADFAKGHYRSVKLFDDLVNLLRYGIPTGCGIHGRCSPQMVIEADGSAYPCDFYCTDQWRLGNLAGSSLKALYESKEMAAFLRRPRTLPTPCEECTFFRFCGGQCHRMQQTLCGTDCGYRRLLESALPRLAEIAKQ